MVGLGLALGVWVLGAVAPPAAQQTTIVGGTPAQQAYVKKMLDGIPTCWKSPNGKPLQVFITTEPIVKKMKPGDVQGANAFYVGKDLGQQPPDKSIKVPSGDFVWIWPGMFPVMQGQQALGEGCGSTPLKMDGYEVLVHELGHRLQWTNGGKDVDGFLKIRYKRVHDAVVNDPNYQAGVQEYSNAQLVNDHARMCAAVAKIDAAFKKHKMVERFEYDSHALDEEGAEYFAMAIETLATHADLFCSSYSKTEQAYLLQHFGGCLKSFSRPLAPCVYDSVPKTGGTGGGGGPWLQR